MKSVTEFWSFALVKGNKAKAELVAAGKSAEEIAQGIGEAMKFEGEKLKQFLCALDVATAHAEGLSRVLVVSLNEGEVAPPKATKVEEMHYVPEFQKAPAPVNTQKSDAKGGRGKGGGGPGRGKGGGGPKESPWGLSPEQKAAKKAQQSAGAAAKPKTQ
jgi:hypothetical protein